MIVTGEKIGRWAGEKAGVPWTPQSTAIGWVREGQPVAAAIFDGFTGPCISMHGRCDNPAKVSRVFWFAIFDYPFNELGVKRLITTVSTANQKALEFDAHLGWKRETTLKDYFTDGDAVVLQMYREDCRWLNIFKDRQDALRRMANAASRSFQDNDGSALWQTLVT